MSFDLRRWTHPSAFDAFKWKFTLETHENFRRFTSLWFGWCWFRKRERERMKSHFTSIKLHVILSLGPYKVIIVFVRRGCWDKLNERQNTNGVREKFKSFVDTTILLVWDRARVSRVASVSNADWCHCCVHMVVLLENSLSLDQLKLHISITQQQHFV